LPAAAPIALWRLDCGSMIEPDAGPSPWRRGPLPVSCYLIRNGDRYLLWDAGLSARLIGNPQPTMRLERTIPDQLRQLGLSADRITFLGISHYHGDHTGQASAFPGARLLIGAADLTAMRSAQPPTGVAPSHLRPWIEGGAPVTALIEDHDVFGDGRVTVLMTPGHTPGHSALLVKLAGGTVMLTGDLWLSHAEALKDDMPDFNTSRAETIASRQRFGRIAWRNDATIVIQHERADVDLLPAFPQAAS
jgi:glyoxylase-like metal-dependent hydrolase (beta-lactamase superfamily II)